MSNWKMKTMFENGPVEKLKTCLACGGNCLTPLLDLGKQPPANSLKKTAIQVQEQFPLAINRCLDCYHVQLTHIVNPEILYKDYPYVSGTSKTMMEYFEWFSKFADEYYKSLNDRTPKVIVEIGCNDGSQLDQFNKLNGKFVTIGVDPAENIIKSARKKSDQHILYCGFFDNEFVEWMYDDIEFGYNKPDIVVAQNVFAHNPDPFTFLNNVKNMMAADGLLFIQTSQANMILNGEFDTIYHEHISFYNINSMQELCKRAGMELIDVIKTPLHGTSYIFVIGQTPPVTSTKYRIENLIAMEKAVGLYSPKTYYEYKKKCEALPQKLTDEITQYWRSDVGKMVVGYGAAAKGMTLINYTDIGKYMSCIVDDNPLKQGKFAPGSKLPIINSDFLKTTEDSIVFIPLAWNFFDEIVSKIKSIRDNPNDVFVRYFPKVESFRIDND